MVLLLALPGLATAKVELQQSMSLRSGLWSGDRSLSAKTGIASGTLWARGQASLEDYGELVLDGWIMAQSASSERGGLIREAFWRYDFSDYSLKLGRQIVVWGRADAINPTDNLSPRNYRLLTPEDGEQRYGNNGVNLSRDTPWGLFQGLWFPHAHASSIPLQPLNGVSYRVDESSRDQWALKWDTTLANADGSLSYFDGTDPLPVLVPGGLSGGGALVRVRAGHVRVLGADFSMSRDGTIWRAEAAWSRPDSDGRDDFRHKKPQLALVAGGEWQLPTSATLGMQLTWIHVYDHADARRLPPGLEREVAIRQLATSNQTRRDQYGFTWRLAKRWYNDLLEVEFSGAANHSDGSGIARLQSSYAINDQLMLKTGVDHYYGPAYSFFGQLGDNRLVFAQLEYGF
ncbi:hypothetical protein [Phytopseudomonas dryadis]|uniref:Porin n=1 Tax=Phytopseudomonas dryadis TaxID=2487520 RepID=A0A4Q9R6Q7_9GAMM|nr:hypothetical protein [Pseudomonas dryadis]TBU96222.1 hypothetical protein DNK44_05560 [Pseudomonas dryadis]